MFRLLAVCTLSILASISSFGQEKGELVQNANPEFFRSMNHFIRVNQDREIQGYRVQVFNGQRNEANRWRSEAITALPDMKSMVIFETPDYKLQIGNYRTLYEAEAALARVREHFPGAFIIETAIDYPELIEKGKEDLNDPNEPEESQTADPTPQPQRQLESEER